MLIETISGHETFPGSDIRVLLFYQNLAGETASPLFDLAKRPNTGVTQVGSPNHVLACEANRNHGMWTTARYAVRENSFIDVFISKKLPGDFIKHNKQLMLYNRAGAALRRITLPFTGHPNATLGQGHIEGRFDIMTTDQIISAGIDISETMLRQFDFTDEDPTDFYVDRVIEAERDSFISAKNEAIVTEKGNTVRIAKPRRRVIVPR